jgi:hypothetical protein
LRRCAVALALVHAAPASGTAQQGYEPEAPPANRPAFRTLRFDEDWSALADPSALPSHDRFDPVKHVALGGDGSVWLSFGAQARGRMEAWSGYEFGGQEPGDDDDDVYGLSRLLAHIDLHLGDHVRVFAQGKSALATDVDLPGGKTPAQVDDIDLQNAFAEITVPIPGADRVRLRVRGGRQEMLFGNQRLVSPSDWSNTRRTFDGVRADLEAQGWRIASFWTRPVRVREEELNDHAAGDEFYGVYATGRLPFEEVGGPGLDLYWLGLERGNRTVNGTSGPEDLQTVGLRTFGDIFDTGFDFELEGAFQTGDLDSRSIRAGMVSAELGFTPAGVRFAPRVHVGGDWASGDHERGGSVQTFDPLFPFGHRFFGEIDAVGRSNVRAVSGGIALRPLAGVTAAVTAYRFWLDDSHDALYSATGAVLRPGAPGASRDVGTEVDLQLGWQWDPHTLLGLGYGHLFPDDFVEETGPSRAIDFFYLFLQFTM